MRFIATLTLMLCLVFGRQGTPAFALTLGLPEIQFDSTQGGGQGQYTYGRSGVLYLNSFQDFRVSAAATSISFNGVTSIPITGGTVDYYLRLIDVTTDQTTVTAHFTGVSSRDFVVMGDIGNGFTTLLAGSFRYGFTMTGLIGTNSGFGEGMFRITEGALLPYYAQGNGLGGDTNMQFTISSSFSPATFSSLFSGTVKGDLAPVPEASSLILLGVGLSALGMWQFFKR